MLLLVLVRQLCPATTSRSPLWHSLTGVSHESLPAPRLSAQPLQLPPAANPDSLQLTSLKR